MKYTCTAPATEPISLADAREHIKALAGVTEEDAAIITPLIGAAREYCEMFTGLSVEAETVKAYPACFERIMRLPRPPIRTITSVKYTDSNGTETIMPASNYTYNDEAIAFRELPSFDPAQLRPIEIEYTAGFESLPLTIRQAMLLLIGHWYVNREAVVVGPVTSVEVQFAVKSLLRQWKAWWF